MHPLLTTLNEAQRAAASHKDGPFVVFAGAGSGKTRIITCRIALLIDEGVAPWEILAMTFTNKAAGEMKERVSAMSPESNRVLVTTFHSACARWLREFAGELGFQSNFTIYDDSDATKLLKKIIKEANPKGDLPALVSEMKSFLHQVKTLGYFPGDIEALGPNIGLFVPLGGVALYRKYQEALADCNAMDFGDLLLNVLLLLKRNASVSKILQSRYRYILVDEFQDTNRTQFEMLRILSEGHQNLFVVGDDDQSIYSWRGATPSNIIDFQQTFPKAQRIALEQNYRCTANIVNSASKMIAHNKNRAEKTLFTKAQAGELIDIHIESDGEMEAWWIVNAIKDEKTTFSYNDIAIFYRTNSQSRVLEEALRRENIPYKIFGSVEFYDRLEVKDILAYMRVIVNPRDEISMTRILNVPARGIGAKAIEAIVEEGKKRELPMIKAIKAMADEGYPRIGPKLKYFSDLISALTDDLKQAPLQEVMGTLLEAIDYPEHLKKKFPDQYIDKMDNIHELGSALADYAKRFPDHKLDEWLQSITLVRESNENEASTGVSLMTLHMAKGLEFQRVFLSGVEDGLIPHKNSVDDQAQLEEERRLLYVGMTRAMKKLSLVGANRRRMFNNYLVNSPSRFFDELPEDCLNISFAARQTFGDYGKDSDNDGYHYESDELSYEVDSDSLSTGSIVSHPTFGRGEVQGFDHKFGQNKVIVKFYEFGLRKIKASQLKIPNSNLSF